MTNPKVLMLVGIILISIVLLIFAFFRHYKWSMFRVDHMKGERFERFLVELYERLGYKCTQTKKTGDQGADVILKKGFQKIGVQAKRYRGSVGNSAVQEAVASRKYYGFTSVKVVTNSTFTKSAVELAKANKVELIDREKLKKLIKKAKKR